MLLPMLSAYQELKHFLDNRKMFFGALLVTALIDIADTLIKSQLGLPALPIPDCHDPSRPAAPLPARNISVTHLQ